MDTLKDFEVSAESETLKRLRGLCLAVGGTLSGEHGVGVLKRPFLERALGPVSINVQRSLKRSLDPMNILNPGKIFAV